MDTLRLLFSVHGSLFLHWPFLIGPIASFVSRSFRVLLLRSVTRYPLWFYLGDGVACWAESLFFLFVPSCSTPVVRQALVCCFLFFLLGSLSGFLSLPSSFCLGSFGPLYWWVSFPSSLCFSSRLAFLSCLLNLHLLSFAIFPFPP